jgi:hypothetical protein
MPVLLYIVIITLGFAAQEKENEGPSVKSHPLHQQPHYEEVVDVLHQKTSYWKNIHEKCEVFTQGVGIFASMWVVYHKKPTTHYANYVTCVLGASCLGSLKYSEFAHRQYIHHQHDLNAVLKFNHQPGFIYGTEDDIFRTSNKD